MRINSEISVGLFVLAALSVFFYMTFHIGVFRADTSSYRKQTIYFKDLSGLTRKAEVKIAGVKVGWVEDVDLRKGDVQYQARADIMIHRKYQLRSDASAIVRQDGLLGVKYLEIAPGDPLLPLLKAGDSFVNPGSSPVSVDELLREFKNIATNVGEITSSIKDAVGGATSRERLRETFDNIHIAAERIANVTDVADRILVRNEQDINGIISDLRSFSGELKNVMPLLRDDFRRVLNTLGDEVLPSFQKNVEKIGNAFDTDFGKIANKLEQTADAIEQAALQTKEGFKSIGAVADKINDGKGLIGKLVNDDQAYHDLKVAILGLKNYFSKIESLGIVFDSHFETMHRPAENFIHKDSKGYFDIRVHPSEDHFYVLQMVGSMKGSVKRYVEDRTWYDSKGNLVDPASLNISDNYKLFNMPRTEKIVIERDTVKFGFQFGKVFRDLAFRFGMMENSFGLGVDYNIPFDNEKLRWVTSLEAFDLRGRDRLQDSRPHLKWANRVFILRNIYFDFGADDFVSKHNANTFVGAGLRFGDDDIKYFISKLGLGKSS